MRPSRSSSTALLLVAAALALVALLRQLAPAASSALPPGRSVARFSFTYVEVDPDVAGDVKLAGDIDGDGFADLVVGGMPGEKLNWYRYPGWQKTIIATPQTEFTTDGAMGDVDGDGDLDIVLPDGDSGQNLLWYENPRPVGDAGVGSQWQRHEVGAGGGWIKDVELADFDGNGRLDIAARTAGEAFISFQTAANSWSRLAFNGLELGSEGLASGDIDGDGPVDLVLRGVWLANPGGAAARDASKWEAYTIGPAPANFKALVVDLNQDGQADVLFSSSEDTADVVWWSPDSGDPTGRWRARTILPDLEKAHTLQAADMDGDFDLDVVLAQMHTSAAQEIIIMENLDGAATGWRKQVIGSGGLHNGVVVDIGNDGDYDLFGANWTGNPPVKLWLNRLDAPPVILDPSLYLPLVVGRDRLSAPESVFLAP